MTTTNGSDMLPEATLLSADDMSCKISQTATEDDCETNSNDKITIGLSKIPTDGSCMSVDVMPMSTDGTSNLKSKSSTSDDCASADDVTKSNDKITIFPCKILTDGSCMSVDVMPMSTDDASNLKSKSSASDNCFSVKDETNSSDGTTIAQSKMPTDGSCMSVDVMPMDAATSNQEKTAQNFNALVSSFTSEEGTPFTNGYAYNIYTSLGKKTSKAADFLVKKLKAKGYACGHQSIRNVLMRFIKTFETLKKCLSRNWFRITSYFNQMFRVPQMKEKKPTLAVSSSEPTPLGVNGESPESNAAKEPEIQLKTDCKKCPAMRRSYWTAIKELKEKLRASKQTIKEMSKRFNVKRLNQDMKRKAAVRAKLRQKIHDLKKENSSLKKQVENLKKNDYKAMARAEKRKRKRAELRLNKTMLKNKDLRKENQLNNEKIMELDYEVDCLRTDENSS